MENLGTKIMEILLQKHRASGGHNGTYVVGIKSILNIEYAVLRKSLNRLYKEKKIIIREGSQGKLIFPNVRKKE